MPADIAEGNGRESTGDYVRFLQLAQGSLKELETHWLSASETETCARSAVEPLLEAADQLGRMIRALIRSLQSKRG
jgi:four helix bundle protein